MDSQKIDILKVIKEQGGKIYGELRLHKVIFLLSHKYGVPISISFRKYRYGPYSTTVRRILLNLEKERLIKIRKQGNLKIIELTEKGKLMADKSPLKIPPFLLKKATDELKEEAYDFMNHLLKIKSVS